MSPVGTTYWIIPGYLFFWTALLIALVVFWLRVINLIKYIQLGQKEERSGHVWLRTGKVIGRVMFQVCSLRSLSWKDRAGLGHALIFWGFLFFALSYLLFVFLGEGFGMGESLRSNILIHYYAATTNIAGIVVLSATVWAAVRRYLLRPNRLEIKAEAGIILTFITLLMLSAFVIDGLEQSLYKGESMWTPLGSYLAEGFKSISPAVQMPLYNSLWWFHYLLILVFLAYVPFSKHLHILASFFNIYFASLEPKGALKLVNLEASDSFGVSKINGFTRKQLLDLVSCTECGRCQVNCPAFLTGKELSPKKVVLDLKHDLLQEGPVLIASAKSEKKAEPKNIIGQVIPEEVIWDCTTCRSCQEQCPVLIEHIDKIIDMRRNLVLEQGKIPESAVPSLRSLEDRGHPWRGTTASRNDWAKGLKAKPAAENKSFDILYWVGCTAALEERNIKVANAFGRIMEAAGVNFGYLGVEETCCGEPARRFGNEYLYQMQATKNIETFNKYNVKKIVTACPHCFNTIKNEYPQLGGMFEVYHHAQFIWKLIGENKIRINKPLAVSAVYHDSCYLGRHNDIFEEPRNALKAISSLQLKEMERSRYNGFCCGAGGGHAWMEESKGKRINQERTEEAIKTGARTIVSACPFCLQMFEDGRKALNQEEKVRALDLAEVLAEVSL